MIPDWPVPSTVRAWITTRDMPGHSNPPFDSLNLGNRCGDVAATVAANRAALVEQHNLPAPPCWLHQVHAADVFEATAAPRSGIEEPIADAAIARTADVVLAVLSADCLPLLFCIDDGSAVAVAHAGWRGLSAGVIEATLARLAAPASRVLVWLGPAIGARSYETGDEVRARFVDQSARAAAAFVATRPGHWQCDLYLLARQRLAAAGIERIHGGVLDTFTDARFYSYRRSGTTGRFASLIWRADTLN